MVSSWAITVDLTWESVLTTPVAVYGTITAGVPAAVAQNSVTGRAIGSIGDHIGVLINVAGQTYQPSAIRVGKVITTQQVFSSGSVT